MKPELTFVVVPKTPKQSDQPPKCPGAPLKRKRTSQVSFVESSKKLATMAIVTDQDIDNRGAVTKGARDTLARIIRQYARSVMMEANVRHRTESGLITTDSIRKAQEMLDPDEHAEPDVWKPLCITTEQSGLPSMILETRANKKIKVRFESPFDAYCIGVNLVKEGATADVRETLKNAEQSYILVDELTQKGTREIVDAFAEEMDELLRTDPIFFDGIEASVNKWGHAANTSDTDTDETCLLFPLTASKPL